MKTAIVIMALLAMGCTLLGPRGSKNSDRQIIAAFLLVASAGAIGFWHFLNMTLK